MKNTTIVQGTFWYDSPEAMKQDVAQKTIGLSGTLDINATVIAWPWHILAPNRYLYRIHIQQITP